MFIRLLDKTMSLFHFFQPPKRYPPPPQYGPTPNQQSHESRWGFLEAIGALVLFIALIYYLGHPDSVFKNIIEPEKVPEVPYLPPHPKKSGGGWLSVLIILLTSSAVAVSIWLYVNNRKHMRSETNPTSSVSSLQPRRTSSRSNSSNNDSRRSRSNSASTSIQSVEDEVADELDHVESRFNDRTPSQRSIGYTPFDTSNVHEEGGTWSDALTQAGKQVYQKTTGFLNWFIGEVDEPKKNV